MGHCTSVSHQASTFIAFICAVIELKTKITNHPRCMFMISLGLGKRPSRRLHYTQNVCASVTTTTTNPKSGNRYNLPGISVMMMSNCWHTPHRQQHKKIFIYLKDVITLLVWFIRFDSSVQQNGIFSSFDRTMLYVVCSLSALLFAYESLYHFGWFICFVSLVRKCLVK